MDSRVVPITFLVVSLAFASVGLFAEVGSGSSPDAAVSAASSTGVEPTAPTEAALCIPDTEIFRRTPVVDGKVDDSEWDTFYTYSSGDWSITTFVDWDSRNLYLAAKSNRAFDMMGILDGNADGWFHGDENYQFTATRATDGKQVLTVSRYESRNIKLPMATPVSESEAGMVEMKSSADEGRYAVEMRVPAALIRGFKLVPGMRIGLHILAKTSADEASWVPTNQVGDLKECTLVTKKLASLKPLELGFDLKQSAVARGDTLSGKFHLKNSGNEYLDVRSFVIGGEGRAAGYLNSQLIRLEGLAPKQHVSHNINTPIPSEMPSGSWAIGAEVRSNGTKLGAGLVSFEVLDPFDLELRIPTGDVRADVKDVSLAINVRNNMRRTISGIAKITLPVGWELWRNMDTRSFSVSPKGGVTGVLFKAKPPLGEIGEVVVRIEVTVGKDTKVAEGRFRMVNP